MKKQVGIWIDTKKAIVVSLSGKNQDLNVLESGIETRERYDGEGKAFGRFGEQYLNDEKAKEHRLEHQASSFMNSLLKFVESSDELVIFGPAGMKTELKKEVEKHQHLSSKLQSVETADSMTDNQVAAWVRAYFNN